MSSGIVEPNKMQNTSMDWNPIAAAGGSVLNFVGGLISGHKQRKAQAAINAQNIAMQRETNDLNYRINQENNEFNREQTWKMFNAQNQWNSASNQMKLAREAGINPFVAAQEQGLGDSVNHDAAATTAGVPSMVAPRADMIDSSAFNSLHAFSELANVFKTLAEAKKSGVETHRIEAMLDGELLGQQLSNSAQSLENFLNRKYGDKERYAGLMNAAQDFFNKVQELANMKATGENIKADTADKWADTFLKIAQKKLAGGQYELVKKQVDNFMKQLNAQLELWKKQGNAAVTSAEASKLQAKVSEFVANNPTDWQGMVSRVVQGLLGDMSLTDLGKKIHRDIQKFLKGDKTLAGAVKEKLKESVEEKIKEIDKKELNKRLDAYTLDELFELPD